MSSSSRLHFSTEWNQIRPGIRRIVHVWFQSRSQLGEEGKLPKKISPLSRDFRSARDVHVSPRTPCYRSVLISVRFDRFRSYFLIPFVYIYYIISPVSVKKVEKWMEDAPPFWREGGGWIELIFFYSLYPTSSLFPRFAPFSSFLRVISLDRKKLRLEANRSKRTLAKSVSLYTRALKRYT